MKAGYAVYLMLTMQDRKMLSAIRARKWVTLISVFRKGLEVLLKEIKETDG